MRGPIIYPPVTIQHLLHQPAEAVDDEMVDEDNDFDGGDTSDMVIDAQTQTPTAHLDNAGPPIPPPAPSMNPYITHMSGPANPPLQTAGQGSSWLYSTQPGQGNSNYTIAFQVHGPASPAALRPPRANGTASEASTASLNTSQQGQGRGGPSAGYTGP
jgi:hypothetical protein